MNPLSSGFYLNQEQWAQMEADVASKVPEEACGIVAGNLNQARQVIPITNMLHHPFRFRMEPEEQLKAFLLAEEKGWDILAIYHSHPHGIDTPSVTDHEELTFPGVIYLIWYQKSSQWLCRAYLMDTHNNAYEVPLILSTGQ